VAEFEGYYSSLSTKRAFRKVISFFWANMGSKDLLKAAYEALGVNVRYEMNADIEKGISSFLSE